MKFGISMLTLMGIMLVAGCATEPFNAAAMQSAWTERNAEYGTCAQRWAAGEFSTSSLALECYLTADQKFVSAIQLRDTTLFHDYLANMRNVADLLDRQVYTPAQGRAQYDQLEARFEKALAGEYQAYQKEVADETTLDELGTAFLTGAASGYATQPKPVFCSSTVNGRVVNTICN